MAILRPTERRTAELAKVCETSRIPDHVKDAVMAFLHIYGEQDRELFLWSIDRFACDLAGLPDPGPTAVTTIDLLKRIA